MAFIARGNLNVYIISLSEWLCSSFQNTDKGMYSLPDDSEITKTTDNNTNNETYIDLFTIIIQPKKSYQLKY